MARGSSSKGALALLLPLLCTALALPGCGRTENDGGGSGGGGTGSGGSDGLGATGSVTFIKASNTEAGDLFGAAVALSADGFTLVVGAGAESSGATGVDADQADNSATGAGAAYVFSVVDGSWIQRAYLKASNTGAGDAFGSTLALSADGSTLAVGAPYEASAATGIDGDGSDDTAPSSGAVYVFARQGIVWEQQAYVKASNSDADDYFGIALALSADGNRLVVGAEAEDGIATGVDGDQTDKSGYEAGAVYVFERAGTVWQQQSYIKASNTDVFDHFGGAVSLSGDGLVLAVGGYREDSASSGVDGDQLDETASSAGAVYMFGHDGSSWQQTAYLKAGGSDGNVGALFGVSLSLSTDGSTLAVGAVGEDGPAGSGLPAYAGAAYLFSSAGGSWQQAAKAMASNPGAEDEFGYHLDLSGDGRRLLVGAALEDSGTGSHPGDEAAANAGAAYWFASSAATLTQLGFIKAPVIGSGDRFGWSVALSEDGDRLVVGATRESSSAIGIDGNLTDDSASAAGAVYFYDLASGP